MNLITLFFRLPFWLYFLLAAGIGYVTWLFYTQDQADAAARAKALQDGPPAMVLLEAFDRKTHANDAKEVVIRAQLDMSMAYEMTREKNGSVKERSFMVPLYGTKATGTDQPPLALLYEKDDNFKFEELSTKMVGAGAIGPIIEINGVLTYLGQMDDNVAGAFSEQSRAFKAGVPNIDPFRQGRETALSQDKPGADLAVYLFLGATLLCFGMGVYKLVRRRQRAQRGRYG